MFEYLARATPARPRRWLELIMLLPAQGTAGHLYRQCCFAFKPGGCRRSGVARAARHIQLDEHKLRN